MAKTTRVRTSVLTGTCSMYVEGMDMNCPLCGTLVRSGEQHECKRESATPKKKKEGR